MTTPLDELSDREKIDNPGEWPMWPRLPLKRDREDGTGFDMAFIIEGSENEIRLGNVFDPVLATDLPSKEYDDVDAMLADGWRVD